MSTRIHAALFDLDGVILDTEDQYTNFYGAIGCEYLPDVPDFALQIKGRTLVQIYDKWFPGKREIQTDITRRLNAFEQQMDYTLIPGFADFICVLRDASIKTAIVTSSNDEKMHSVFAAHPEFHNLFDQILTAKDYLASKPAPDP